jgi:uracil phosphoribosyltransferase
LGFSLLICCREIVPDVPIGQLLIQRDELDAKKSANLFWMKLPLGIEKMHVFLLDPMLATGGSAVLAIANLIKQGVVEEHVVFVNLVSCPEGIAQLTSTFPKVKIVTSMVDAGLNEKKYIVPGIGDFGDLYYGT